MPSPYTNYNSDAKTEQEFPSSQFIKELQTHSLIAHELRAHKRPLLQRWANTPLLPMSPVAMAYGTSRP